MRHAVPYSGDEDEGSEGFEVEEGGEVSSSLRDEVGGTGDEDVEDGGEEVPDGDY